MMSDALFNLLMAISRLTSEDDLLFLQEFLEFRLHSVEQDADKGIAHKAVPSVADFPVSVPVKRIRNKVVRVRSFTVTTKSGAKKRIRGYTRYLPGTSPDPKAVRKRNYRVSYKHGTTTNADVFGLDVDPRKVLPEKFLEAFRPTGGSSKRLVLRPEYRDIFVGRLENYMQQNNMTLAEFVRAVRPAIRSDQAFRFWKFQMASPQAKTVVAILRKLGLKPSQLGLPDVAL